MTHIMTQENKDCLLPGSLKYAEHAQAQALLECQRSRCYFPVFSGFATLQLFLNSIQLGSDSRHHQKSEYYFSNFLL